ncbi:MAG TPA: hypothetical protein VFB22_00860 [Candidatus Baltobacteraceae bacterium]|nr:hypothetical protein [Candidatus Baltobacteraceae bacterium]
MRKYLALAAVLALAACGGGGGGSATTPTTPSNPGGGGPTTSSKLVTPTFILKIPARGSKAKWAKSKSRSPKYISANTLSVVITLTATSNAAGTSLSGNPAETDVNGTSGLSCTAGCTVNGPPSPPGTNSYKIQTFDTAGGTGNELNAGQLNNVTIAAGQQNSETVTLGAIPASLQISTLPTTWDAGTQSQTTTLTVAAADASGLTIPTGASPNVFYVDGNGNAASVTVTDPDTNAHGTCVASSGTSTCTGGASTLVTFTGPDGSAVFDYDGLAENPVTLTASNGTATSGTASFQPSLNAPAFNAGAPGDLPNGVALTSGPEIDLFATTGTGSTGTEYFTESGWTNSPYNHALTQAAGTCLSGTGYVATALSQFATMSVGTNDTSNGTPITATALASSPVAGSCADTVSDGLTSNSTDGSIALTVTYTTSSIGASAKHRAH